jgi:hypothetical protein
LLPWPPHERRSLNVIGVTTPLVPHQLPFLILFIAR